MRIDDLGAYPEYWRPHSHPDGPIEIDWSHPRVRSLSAYYYGGDLLSNQGGLNDLATPANPMSFSTTPPPFYSGNMDGTVVDFPAGSAAQTALPATQYDSTGGITIACRVQWNAFNSPLQFNQSPAITQCGATSNLALSVDNGGSAFFFYYNINNTTSVNTNIFSSNTPQLNTWYTIVGTSSGTSTHNLFVNGANVGTSATNIGAVGTDYTNVLLGSYLGGAPNFDGQIAWAAIWRRALSQDEIYDLGFRPYIHLRPKFQARSPIPLASVARTATTTYDAFLATSKTKTATFDAMLSKAKTKTVTYDGYLATKHTRTATYDASIRSTTPHTVTTSFDAFLTGRGIKLATYDAVLIPFQTAFGSNYITLPAVQRVFEV